MPNLLCKTAATGVMQFVVHDALEIIGWSLYFSSLTAIINVGVVPSSFVGAEMITFLAPARRCAPAKSELVNRPVDSKTTSTDKSRQGNMAGSFSAKIGNLLLSTIILPTEKLMGLAFSFFVSKLTVLSYGPYTES